MKKFFCAIMLVIISTSFSFAQTRVGWWKFDDSNNLLKAEVGNELIPVGNNISVVEGPEASNGAVNVTRGDYFEVVHNIQVKDNENYVNEYSLVIDFKVPQINTWYTFFQTDLSNASDGDCFINTAGNIGTYSTGYTDFAIKAGEWYRLVISVELGSSYKYYLDGNLVKIANVQYRENRFSLENDKVLLFADNDGDDGNFDVAEVAVYDGALNDAEVSELGGYGHTPKYVYNIPVVKPFLQTPGSDYIYVSWQDTSVIKTQVEYGAAEGLGNTKTGTCETIGSYPHVWHTVKLTDLTPNTKYYYKINSGSGSSPVYSFRTQPESSSAQGHVRFLLFGDTQQNPDLSTTIVNSSVTQMKNLFGSDYRDSLNFVMHIGDCIQEGNDIEAYTNELLEPMDTLSSFLPFVIVAGNHELDSKLFYSYMKYDDITPFSFPEGIFERFWSFKVARSLFVGLNSNIVYTYGDQEKIWFEDLLQTAEADANIDQVFCFIHHCPYSELWPEGESFYSQIILGIMQKYSKAQQLSYGHTHAFEVGAIASLADNTNGDIRYVCVGGGGGNRDYFSGSAVDLSSINMSYAQNFFVLADIDVKNKSNSFKVYGVGDLAKNPEPDINLIDSWYHKLNQDKPETPSCVSNLLENDFINLLSTPFEGVDSLMSVQLQATTTLGDYSLPILDKTRDWRDVYGVDDSGNPIDVNMGIDLIKYSVSSSFLTSGTTYGWRVRYRDHNLKWSEWSNEVSFIYGATAVNDVKGEKKISVVNPINDCITIIMPNNESIENVAIYNASGHVIGQYKGNKNQIDASGFPKGMYLIKVRSRGIDSYFKCIKL